MAYRVYTLSSMLQQMTAEQLSLTVKPNSKLLLVYFLILRTSFYASFLNLVLQWWIVSIS